MRGGAEGAGVAEGVDKGGLGGVRAEHDSWVLHDALHIGFVHHEEHGHGLAVGADEQVEQSVVRLNAPFLSNLRDPLALHFAHAWGHSDDDILQTAGRAHHDLRAAGAVENDLLDLLAEGGIMQLFQ